MTHIDFKGLNLEEASVVIVDGVKGQVILNPTEATLQQYKKLKNDIFESYQKLVGEVFLEAKTTDHKKIDVFANIEKLTDLDHPSFLAAEGIGLFRSEFLFLQKEIFSITEQEQYLFYSQMIRKAKGVPIVLGCLI